VTDLLALTAELVGHRSESFREGPFVDWLESEMRPLEHLELTRVGDNLVARTTGDRPLRLLVVGHTDTVPAVDGNEVPRLEGDVLWGLGASDMKGGLAVALHLARTVTDPAVEVTYVFYAREEVAGAHNGLAELVRERPDLLAGDCAVLGEPTGAAIEAGCQGAIRFAVALRGARAHTARPWMGRNAIHRLGPVLDTLATYHARQPTIGGCTYREAVQAVGVEGGVAGNVVPDRAVLTVHHRFAPDRSPAEAEAWFRRFLAPHLDEGDTVEVLDVSPACPPSLDHPLLAALIERNALEVRAKLGWTDVARFAQLGIPAANFGPGDATVAHTGGEHLHRAPLELVAAALEDLLTRGR
jgi:succinyl-diaminopimelate desuccinylase